MLLEKVQKITLLGKVRQKSVEEKITRINQNPIKYLVS